MSLNNIRVLGRMGNSLIKFGQEKVKKEVPLNLIQNQQNFSNE